MSEEIERNYKETGLEIAVIGMAGRFPGAGNIDEFWENLKNGIESISFLSGEELAAAGVDEQMLKDPNYVGGNSILPEAGYFDPAFFGYTPAEAWVMDPQVRLFHQYCWHVLEDAGYDPESYGGLIGIYAGAADNLNWKLKTMAGGGERSASLQFSDDLLSNKDLLAMLISYKLNLRGPSSTIYTACSTSLVAVHMACRALLSGECDMAAAGGVCIETAPKRGYIYYEGMMLSPDGHCRAFDAEAGGTVFGDGVAVVLLKTLEDAVNDGDHIYAIIKGSAVNNDGSRKVGYTAPSVNGQVEAIRAAHQVAETDPATLGYIETHGTGTSLGDPIEIKALTRAFNTDKKGFCKIGSVKTNIGHLDAAAGAASFIKTVLALKHHLIPPSLNFRTPNPQIDFDGGPFIVNTRLSRWDNGGYPLRAAVSSFGFGGTNAHVVLEEAPGVGGQGMAGRKYRLILLSGLTETALQKVTENFADYLKKNPDLNLADAAYTLQVGRKALPHRRITVVSGIDGAVENLSDPNGENLHTFVSTVKKRPVIFMFSGQGSQYVDMGLDLYRTEPIFREEIDRCFRILKSLTDHDIKAILHPGHNRSDRSYMSNIDQTEIAQPLLFVFEYAVAKLAMAWGIAPRAMIGHSIGEYVAACLAGVFSLEDALKIVVLRGRSMQQVPEGAMLSVPLPEKEVVPLLSEELALAAVNTTDRCVVSGPHEAVDAFAKMMEEKGTQCRSLHTSHAFHSAMMDPVPAQFKQELEKISLNGPKMPCISNLTGQWLTAEQAADPGYWCSHLRQTVRFADGLAELLKEENAVFLELGPGKALSTFARQHKDIAPGQIVINLLRHPREDVTDDRYLLNKIGHLWLYNVKIDWRSFYRNEKRSRLPLPLYPFEAQPYWIDGDPFEMGLEKSPQKGLTGKRPDISSWFYIPQWKRSLLHPGISTDAGEPLQWLMFADECGLGRGLKEQLEKAGHEVWTVKQGAAFGMGKENSFTLNPANREDYRALFRELEKKDKLPTRIVHLWNVAPRKEGEREVDKTMEILDIGFYSLLYLAQSLTEVQVGGGDIQITVVSTGMQEVAGEKDLCPARAALLGPVKVVPQEYPHISCRSIDITLPEPKSGEEGLCSGLLLAEITHPIDDTEVAFRGNHRWIKDYEPFPLERKKDGTLLKQGGVYLITGGLGGIGPVLAEFLAANFRAKLVLTGRTAFPAKEEQNPSDRKVQKVRTLEAAGAEVLVLQADAADERQMREVIRRTEERFGRIDGVIHAAGTSEEEAFGSAAEMTKVNCEKHFHPKIYGTMVLEKVLRGRDLDFCLVMSSLAAVLGGLGFTAYSAANLFLDAFVRQAGRLNPGCWLSVNWDEWQLAGEEGAELSLTAAEGVEVFERLLAWAINRQSSRVAISTGDIGPRIDRWIKREFLREMEGPDEDAVVPMHSRPALSTPYVAPRDETEQTVAQVWQRFFGLEQVGIHDDFFELGGDSLKAMTITGKLHKILNVNIPLTAFFKQPTVKAMSEYIKGASEEKYITLEKAEKQEYYALSSSQRRLYLLHHIEADNTAYNIDRLTILEGAVEKERVAETFRRLIRRHESLRTSFRLVNNQPVQRVHDEVAFDIEYFDLATGGTGEKINFVRPFDLSRAPLLRVGLAKLAGEQYLFMMDVHHIISDGISVNILQKDFMAFYASENLSRLKLQYPDFCEWQNNRIASARLKEREVYWLERFAGEVPVINLPLDYPRPSVQTFSGSSEGFEIAEAETRRLRAIGSETGTTMFMLLLGIFNVLLSKLSGQGEIVVGTPIAGRNHLDFENVIGIFINTLALRNCPTEDKPFSEFLQEVKAQTLADFENQEYQFEDLVDRVAVNRDVSRNPLFDVLFSLQNMESTEVEIPGLKLKPYDTETKTSQFDMTLLALEGEEKLYFTIEYCIKLFKKETIRRFVTYFKEIVSTVTRAPGTAIMDINILPLEEKNRLLYELNDTRVSYSRDKTIHELFARQVEEGPDHIALVRWLKGAGGCAVSYRELNERVCQLAGLLREKGAGPGTIAALLVQRSLEMVIGMMAVLKTGAAYLPIDPEYPAARIKYILENSRAALLLTQTGLIDQYTAETGFSGAIVDIFAFEGVPGEETGDRKLPAVSPRSPAYVIYTSGTTANPKGVVVEHGNVVNFAKGMTDCIDFSAGKTILALTTISFDISALEILVPLAVGMKIVIAVEEQQGDLRLLEELITRDRVDMIQVTPSRLKLLLGIKTADEALFPPGIGELMVGGEAFPPNLFEQVKKKFSGKIYNLYGPTETTIWSTLKDLTASETVTIGRPIANTQVYILDRNLRLLPAGAAGELCIGGDGVTRGYLDNPELTAEKFPLVSKKFLRGVQGGGFFKKSPPGRRRQYKTGDLARWLPDGDIECLGRVDHQVKIRGFRIELEEIEEQLLTLDYIKEAVVISAAADNSGDQFLCAYMVSGKEPDVTRLREYLGETLPGYMIPSYFMPVESIPLTPNGKVDRKALPKPDGLRPQLGTNFIAPGTGNEKVIADAWKEVLNLDKVGIHDNFFALGGNSLTIILLNNKLKEVLDTDIPVVVMFRYLTIASFARYLSESGAPGEEMRPEEALDRAQDRYKNITNRFRRKK